MKLNLKIFKNFLRNYDIRWKLVILGKHLRVRLWPKFLENNGANKIIFKIIFNLIFFEKIRSKKKEILNEINIITKNDQSKVNFLISSPSSGGNFVRYLLSSHFEIFYKIGNGIPKFNNLTNKWMFSASPIISGDIFNFIELEKHKFNFKFYTEQEFNKKKIILSRYPYPSQGITLMPNLFKVEKMRPVILFRDCLNWLISRYSWRERSDYAIKDEIDTKLILNQISDYKKYITYWLNYTNQNKPDQFLLIDFESLIKDEKKTFIKILKFVNYEILSDVLIEKILYVNSKEYAKKDLGVKFSGTRFTDENKKMLIREKISNFCENQKEFLEINELIDQLKKNLS